jgi:hypothetical protein
LVDFRTEDFKAMSHSKVLASFEKAARIGGRFYMTDLYDCMIKTGLHIGNGYSKRALTPAEVYAFLSPRLECVNPATGLFTRLA